MLWSPNKPHNGWRPRTLGFERTVPVFIVPLFVLILILGYAFCFLVEGDFLVDFGAIFFHKINFFWTHFNNFGKL